MISAHVLTDISKGDLAFGEPFDCLEMEQYHFWVAFLFGHLKWGALRASVNFYPWIASLLFMLVPKSLLSSKAHQAHFEMTREKVQKRIALQTDRKDFLSYILRANDEKGMTIPELEATSSVIILAGSESTSTMLTGTTNFLIRNPSKLEKLVNEIRTSFTNETDITLDALEQLPYLKAVFQEGFRVAPPVPTQIPRVVPPEGAIVCGNALPGNVSYTDSTLQWLPNYIDIVYRLLSAFRSMPPTVTLVTSHIQMSTSRNVGCRQIRLCTQHHFLILPSPSQLLSRMKKLLYNHSPWDLGTVLVSIWHMRRCAWF